MSEELAQRAKRFTGSGSSGRVTSLEEFLALVREGKGEELVARLATLSPSQRRALAGPVKELGKAEGGILRIFGGWRAPTRPVPFLLATPTRHTGHIDPHVLVDRIAAAEAGGWQPWPNDLAQALLRLPRDTDPDARDRARALLSPAGQRLATVLATGIPDPGTRRIVVRRHRGRHESVADRKRPDHLALVAIAGDPPDPLVARVFAFDPPEPFGFGDEAIWPEVLPSHREVVAARMLAHLEYGLRGAHEVLPRLAEAEGPCGPAMGLALVYGLAAKSPQARVAATDALLALAPSDVDPATVGAEIGTLAGGGQITLSRVVDPLNQAATAPPRSSGPDRPERTPAPAALAHAATGHRRPAGVGEPLRGTGITRARHKSPTRWPRSPTGPVPTASSPRRAACTGYSAPGLSSSRGRALYNRTAEQTIHLRPRELGDVQRQSLAATFDLDVAQVRQRLANLVVRHGRLRGTSPGSTC